MGELEMNTYQHIFTLTLALAAIFVGVSVLTHSATDDVAMVGFLLIVVGGVVELIYLIAGATAFFFYLGTL
jgi:hypothetical protein